MTKESGAHKMKKFVPIFKKLFDVSVVDRPIIVCSDLHMGDRSKADDFERNELLLWNVLDVYPLAINVWLGDIMELWQTKQHKIVTAYSKLLKRMCEGNGVYVTGNHDHALSAWHDILTCGYYIRDKVLFIHGHQPDRWNGKYKFIGKTVTWLGGMIERIGWQNVDCFTKELKILKNSVTPSEMTDSNFGEVEDLYVDWAVGEAKEHNCKVIVFGHTHRPGVVERDGVLVVNAGSWVSNNPTFVRVCSREVTLMQAE